MTLSEILGRLDGVRGHDGQYMAKCPAHRDGHQSLSISIGKDGRVLLHCHTGCRSEDIVGAMGIQMKDLFADVRTGEAFPRYNAPESERKAQFEREHIYPGGQLKKVIMRKPNGGKYGTWYHLEDGKWEKGRGGVLPPLYTVAPLEGAVLVAEGEKDVETLHALGYTAASGADGAGPGKWRKEYTEQLRGCHVCVLGDHDKVGRDYATETCNALYGVAASVRLLDLERVWPNIPEHGDVSDMVKELGSERAAELLAQLCAGPEWAPAPKYTEATDKLDVISAVDLQAKDIPPIQFIVDELLPQGLSMLVAPPKYGKSWMVLDLCLSVAIGQPFLGRRTTKCGCLYLALEDSQRRLKGRMNKLLAGKQAPAGFHFATATHDMDNGLFAQLGDFIDEHPDTKLVVIDTLQKVRGSVRSKEGAYANDYREMGALKTFADQRGIALLLVHHLRKMRDDGDPFNMISGTNGLMGSADTTMVLTKEKRGEDKSTLSIVGRDVESMDTVLRLNKETCRWENLGEANWFEEQRALQDYEESPVVKTIKRLLDQSQSEWSGTAQALLSAGQFITGSRIALTARELSEKLKGLDQMLLDRDGIIHERRGNGTGGGKHVFFYADRMQYDDLGQQEVPFEGNGTNDTNGINGVFIPTKTVAFDVGG